MGTHALITIIYNNKIKSFYVHYDGYFSHLGKSLFDDVKIITNNLEYYINKFKKTKSEIDIDKNDYDSFTSIIDSDIMLETDNDEQEFNYTLDFNEYTFTMTNYSTTIKYDIENMPKKFIFNDYNKERYYS